jgi:aminoglycoside phosphotransferase
MSDHLIAEANRHAKALTDERNNLVVELYLLREWQREVIQNARAHHAQLKDAIARAERAEAELTFQQERNSRLFEQRDAAVAAQEKAEAELAAERARLDWLEDKHPILWSLEDWASGPYWLLTDFPGYTEETASQHKTARAAIDAAMEEGAK